MYCIRHLLRIFVLYVALGLWASGETVTGKVVAVSDGDTITVLQDENEVKVRFHGVDCPESGQDFGRAAKDFTADKCFETVVTVVVTDTDRYGRKVGLVILKDGRVLNHDLVAAGLAHWYEEYAPADESLKRLQGEAKAAKRGLWSRPDVVTPKEFRQGKRGSAGPFNPPSRSADTARTQAPQERAGDAVVFVTETGAKFHREGCRALSRSKRAMSRAEAERRYEACGICRP